jgi:tRNA threonylcarbamoyladenosine biosynthesis protein TsaB
MFGSVGLLSAGEMISEHNLNIHSSHSMRLLPCIQKVLEEAAIKADALDCIAISCGPGSFTGLRLGLATAKGISFPFDIPIAPVSSLEALALNFPFSVYPVCTSIDARRNELYYCMYSTGKGFPEKMTEPAVSPPEILHEMIKEKTILAGNGALAFRDYFRRELGDTIILPPLPHNYPRAANVALLGQRQFQRHRSRIERNTDELEPQYIRSSEAERKRRQPEKKRNFLLKNLNFLHIDEILAIEKEAFPDPWQMDVFVEILFQKKEVKAMVLEEKGQVIGYTVGRLYPEGLHIGNLAVRRDRRRKGFGTLLLQNLLDYGRTNGCSKAFLEVRTGNEIAIHLYERFGFARTSVREKYYYSLDEDAIIMEKELKQG